MHEFILASRSPRRQTLFSIVQTPFLVLPSDADETKKSGESPADYVLRLAKMKAEDVGKKVEDIPSRKMVVVAADTSVVDNGQILGKPGDEDEARRILSKLAGRTHRVLSGLAVHLPDRGETLSELVETEVVMRDFSEDEMEAYIASGDPFDKAGAYAIQNDDFHPVQKLQGCYANVMGLPLCHLQKLLAEAGVSLSGQVPVQCQERFDYDCQIPDKLMRLEY